jgi:hypothetical protein
MFALALLGQLELEQAAVVLVMAQEFAILVSFLPSLLEHCW